MHYYSFNIGDYAKHTRHLSNLEDLAYRRLIDLYYTHEKPFPNDTKQISRLIGMRDNLDEIDAVLSDFFTLEDDVWVSKRADEEIAKYHLKADSARANGKKGGRPSKPNKTQSVNLANPAITGSKANQEPLTINQEPITIYKNIDLSDLPLEISVNDQKSFIDYKIKHSTKKKAPAPTDRAIKQSLNQAVLINKDLGISYDEIFGTVEEKGWSGIKLEYFANKNQSGSFNQQTYISPATNNNKMSSFPTMED